jgi:hypothetical protein
VGPFVVVALHEGIEARLLLQHVRRCRVRGFRFERQVQSLMPAVLLRMPRRNPFEADAEARPPDRKFPQPVQGVGGGEQDARLKTANAYRSLVLDWASHAIRSRLAKSVIVSG